MQPCLFGQFDLFWSFFCIFLERRKKKQNLSLLDLSASPQVKSTFYRLLSVCWTMTTQVTFYKAVVTIHTFWTPSIRQAGRQAGTEYAYSTRHPALHIAAPPIYNTRRVQNSRHSSSIQDVSLRCRRWPRASPSPSGGLCLLQQVDAAQWDEVRSAVAIRYWVSSQDSTPEMERK